MSAALTVDQDGRICEWSGAFALRRDGAGQLIVDKGASADGGSGARPIDALLHGYVAGALDPRLQALICSHLMLSPENRDLVRGLEDQAGAALETIEAPKPLRAARDHVLAAIYAGGYYGRGKPIRRDPEIPEPLYRLVLSSIDEMPWQFVTPGLRQHALPDEHGVQAAFLRIRAGQAMPRHTHGGPEVTLVLRGAFVDRGRRYARGDVAIADPAVDHSPEAERGGDCVCFAVTDAPVKLTGPVGRVFQRFFRS